MTETISSLTASSSSDNSGVVFVVVVIALVFAAVLTVGSLIEVLKTPEGARFQSGSKSTWTVVILLTGIIGAVLYQAAGKPKHHEVRRDETKSFYWCQDCNFHSGNAEAARQHRDSGVPVTAGVPTSQKRPAASATPAAPPMPKADLFKTCPDCAEEVRFAARKCRFCGHMFDSADVPG